MAGIRSIHWLSMEILVEPAQMHCLQWAGLVALVVWVTTPLAETVAMVGALQPVDQPRPMVALAATVRTADLMALMEHLEHLVSPVAPVAPEPLASLVRRQGWV